MSICKVCGRKVANVNCNIVRGKSGEWVCKDCLKKANISRLTFSSTNIPAGEVMYKIHAASDNLAHCSDVDENSSAVSQNTTGNKAIYCPRCHNTELDIISEVNSKGVSATKLLLFGALGLSGSGKVTTTNYWVCKSCGYKFKA